MLPVDVLKPVVGDQVYTESAPLALKVTLLPGHMDVPGPAKMLGNGFTVTFTVSLFVQPFPSVPTTK